MVASNARGDDPQLAMAAQIRQRIEDALAREEALTKEKMYANMAFSDSEDDEGDEKSEDQ